VCWEVGGLNRDRDGSGQVTGQSEPWGEEGRLSRALYESPETKTWAREKKRKAALSSPDDGDSMFL
jgi:hypothetical protein